MNDEQQHQQTGEHPRTGEHCCCGAPLILADGAEWCEREFFVTVLEKPYGAKGEEVKR